MKMPSISGKQRAWGARCGSHKSSKGQSQMKVIRWEVNDMPKTEDSRLPIMAM